MLPPVTQQENFLIKITPNPSATLGNSPPGILSIFFRVRIRLIENYKIKLKSV